MRTILLLALSSIVLVTEVPSQDLPPQLPPEHVTKIKTAAPTKLPQRPVAKRATTDAQDNRLKGKVKTLVAEDEDLSGSWKTQGRHFASIEDYDTNGNLIRRIPFNSGKPYEVGVYGYIDGMRVSKYNSIPDLSRLTGAMSAEDKALFKPTRKADPQFTYEYRYKYENRQLAEMQMIHNDGSAGMRYAYRRTGNEFEELAYGYDRNLNRKYVSKLDERGNEIDRLDVAVINQWRGDRKYRFTYESFDNNGNWTKRVKSQVLTENGKEIVKAYYVTYRTITYH